MSWISANETVPIHFYNYKFSTYAKHQENRQIYI